MFVGISLTISQAFVMSILYLFLRNVLGRAFSSDTEVIQNVAVLIKLLAISTFLDSIQGILSGARLTLASMSSSMCERQLQFVHAKKVLGKTSQA
jgi:Na+-driven multidrug efflux pump